MPALANAAQGWGAAQGPPASHPAEGAALSSPRPRAPGTGTDRLTDTPACGEMLLHCTPKPQGCGFWGDHVLTLRVCGIWCHHISGFGVTMS